MAVSMNSSSMRADFMISDAALPQRMADMAEDQAGMFAQLLSDIGDAKADVAADTAVGAVKLDTSNGGKQSDTPTLPDDAGALVKMILRGEIDLKDIPEERITPEFLMLLAKTKLSEKFGKEDDEDEDQNEELFNPAEAVVVEQTFQQEVSNMMLRELYMILEKHNEREDENKVTILDGISEPIDETETLPSILTAEEHKGSDGELFAELIDNLVETVTENLENAEEVAVSSNMDVLVPSENADVPEVVVHDAAVNEMQTVESPKSEMLTEQPVAVQASVSLNEQTAETTAQQSIPVEEFTVKTVKTEKPEIAENAVQQQEVEEPVVVKVVTRNENAQQLDKTADEAPKAADVRPERVKSATEELEMLRNAKAKAANPVEEEFEVKPENTTQPLNADSPIVFKKDDGSEIEVRPSDIIDQTVKPVEKAVTENDEKTEYSLVLTPEELGKITVKLTKAADGAVSVTIMAENARTQRIIEQHSNLMQNDLRSNGVNLESWQTVNERQQETLAQDYNGSSKNPYYRNDDNSAEDNSDDKSSFAEIIASM